MARGNSRNMNSSKHHQKFSFASFPRDLLACERSCFHRWFRLHVSCSTWCHLAMIFIHFMFYRQLDCSTLYSFSSLWNANFVVVRNCDWMLRFHSAPWMLWLGRIWIKNLHAYGGAAEGAWLPFCYHSGAVWWWRFSVYGVTWGWWNSTELKFWIRFPFEIRNWKTFLLRPLASNDFASFQLQQSNSMTCHPHTCTHRCRIKILMRIHRRSAR